MKATTSIAYLLNFIMRVIITGCLGIVVAAHISVVLTITLGRTGFLFVSSILLLALFGQWLLESYLVRLQKDTEQETEADSE